MFRLFVLTSVVNLCRAGTGTSPIRTMSTTTGTTATSASDTGVLGAVDFEVFGTVQGVFFRKHTKQEADKLGLKGWCRNTSKGTVLGHLQGPIEKIETMMQWLRSTGSPASEIDKAEFKNQKEITKITLDGFEIRKDA